LLSDKEHYREANLELAIEMSDVTLRICWDSLKNQHPEANYNELVALFQQRIKNRSRLLIDKNDNQHGVIPD